ncbi:hypothetical protein RchiOBHm_Chr3g0496391 [Rosa chinensis]|uniref:Uncharacterized protein n=1 Tax=Rosa chinensis TaxID=74649 RepID=A0A2P6RHG7_ROSCH|nr:hypothetical protein RchiOBHm_Chr3g0496391 [Rosa chinensis]
MLFWCFLYLALQGLASLTYLFWFWAATNTPRLSFLLLVLEIKSVSSRESFALLLPSHRHKLNPTSLFCLVLLSTSFPWHQR